MFHLEEVGVSFQRRMVAIDFRPMFTTNAGAEGTASGELPGFTAIVVLDGHVIANQHVTEGYYGRVEYREIDEKHGS